MGLDILGRGIPARDKIFDAFRKYCEAIPSDAAQVIKERQRMMREAGLPEADLYKQASLLSIGVFSNTAPTLYWTIWELFSRPDVLAEIREELVETGAVGGSKHEGGFVLDVAALKTKCPLLLSVYEETQRTHHIHANIRQVLEDTVLDGKYLLKKGNYLQMPGGPIHANKDIYGPTALEFDPYRFMPNKRDGTPQVSGSNFLAWGAPPHLCPARQFASTEVLIVAALLATRADLDPQKGIWWEHNPALDYTDMITVLNPKNDVAVTVGVREEWAGQWTLKMGESSSRVSLASG